jgi:hypothetical protein
VLVLLAAVIGSGFWILRWSSDASRATPDTFWYARDAFRYAGYPEHHADITAARITCGALRRAGRTDDYDNCLRYRAGLPGAAPIRFQRIFTSRPGYALLTVPFVRAFGGAGFLIGSAALGVACGSALVLLALAAGLRPGQALLAEVMFYLLPTGLWVSRMLAEAPLVLCLLTSMIGTLLLLRGHARPLAATLLAAGLIGLCLVKPANGVALTAGLIAVAAVRPGVNRARPAHRSYAIVAAVSAAVLGANLAISAALHLPGLDETLQDTFTHHFHQPDVADPWPLLAERLGGLWKEHLAPGMLAHPVIPAVYLLAAIALFQRLRPDAAWSLAVAGLTGAAVISMHPVSTETARLTQVTWIPVAIGLAALLEPRFPRRVPIRSLFAAKQRASGEPPPWVEPSPPPSQPPVPVHDPTDSIADGQEQRTAPAAHPDDRRYRRKGAGQGG